MAVLTAQIVINAVDNASRVMHGVMAGVGSNLSRQMSAIGGRMQTAGMQLSVAATLPAAAIIRTAAEYELAMKRVQAVMVGDTPEEVAGNMKVVNDHIRDFVTQSKGPLDATQLMNLWQAAQTANIPLGETAGFIDVANDMALSFGLNIDEAALTLARLKSSLDLSNEGMREFAGIMALANKEGAVTGQQMIDFMERAAPIAKALGDKNAYKSIAAFGAAMASAGIPAEEAATAMNRMWTNLSGGDRAMKSVKDTLKALGLSSKEVAKNLGTDAYGTMLNILDRIVAIKDPEAAARVWAGLGGAVPEGLRDEQTGGMLKGVVGQYALRQFGALIANIQRVRDMYREAVTSEKRFTEIAKQAGIISEAMSVKWDMLKAKVHLAAVSVGMRWFPVIEKAIDKVSESIIGLSPEKLDMLAKVLGGLAIAGPGLVLAGTALRAMAFGLGGLSMLLTPGGVIAALAALATYATVKNWDKAAPSFERLGAAFGRLGTSVGNLIGKELDWDNIFKNWDENIAGGVIVLIDALTKLVDLLDRAAKLELKAEDVVPKDSWLGSMFAWEPKDFRQGGSVIPGQQEMPSAPAQPSSDWFSDFLSGKTTMVSDWWNDAQRAIHNAKVARGMAPGAATTPPVVTVQPPRNEPIRPPILKDTGPTDTYPVVDVTGKVKAEIVGQADVHVNIGITGPGQITGLSATGSGNIRPTVTGRAMPDLGEQP